MIDSEIREDRYLSLFLIISSGLLSVCFGYYFINNDGINELEMFIYLGFFLFIMLSSLVVFYLTFGFKTLQVFKRLSLILPFALFVGCGVNLILETKALFYNGEMQYFGIISRAVLVIVFFGFAKKIYTISKQIKVR